MKKITLFNICLFITMQGFSQGARLIINNDAYIKIMGNTFITIDNPDPNAITVIGTGGNIVSESETAVIKWNIGADTGTYTIPFTTDPFVNNTKIPLTVHITDTGTGNGSLLFSTYETTTDFNAPYPTGVTNMGRSEEHTSEIKSQ